MPSELWGDDELLLLLLLGELLDERCDGEEGDEEVEAAGMEIVSAAYQLCPSRTAVGGGHRKLSVIENRSASRVLGRVESRSGTQSDREKVVNCAHSNGCTGESHPLHAVDDKEGPDRPIRR
jgi:hypothetical protein